MTKLQDCLISVVVPLYNESAGLQKFHESLLEAIRSSVKDSYEVIYCDDGSLDTTPDVARKLCQQNNKVKLIQLSRNFGKEYALSAGISQARGQAVIMLDGDGQHPVELIPKFIAAWQAGAEVVVGMATNRRSEGFIKRLGSRVFYRVFNTLTGQKLTPGMTDFRLISKPVQTAFLQLEETDRITRGLIDWLGFKRAYVQYAEKPREYGEPGYKLRDLMKLGTNSFVSLSPKPLYLFGYLGVFITTAALILGSSVFIEQIILDDPLHWKFTGTAMLSILLLFLVGLVLTAQGILSLYVSHIHSQTKHRPLYVIDYKNSVGIAEDTDA